MHFQWPLSKTCFQAITSDVCKSDTPLEAVLLIPVNCAPPTPIWVAWPLQQTIKHLSAPVSLRLAAINLKPRSQTHHLWSKAGWVVNCVIIVPQILALHSGRNCRMTDTWAFMHSLILQLPQQWLTLPWHKHVMLTQPYDNIPYWDMKHCETLIIQSQFGFEHTYPVNSTQEAFCAMTGFFFFSQNITKPYLKSITSIVRMSG